MKTDILLVPFGAAYREMRQAALAAEAAGFDGVWTWDHLRDADGGTGRVPECLTTLAALAEAVPRIALGSLVLNTGLRHPGVVANIAATIQEISGNRLILGIGAGGGSSLPYAPEQRMLGMDVAPDKERAARTGEAAQVLRRLWAGDASGFEGEHFTLRSPHGYPRPEVPPPIVVGGFGGRMARIAGRCGDGFNTPAGHPRFQDLAALARAEYERSGRGPDDFLLTAFAGLDPSYLEHDSPRRRALEAAGTARVILLVSHPYDSRAIERAGRLLAR